VNLPAANAATESVAASTSAPPPSASSSNPQAAVRLAVISLAWLVLFVAAAWPSPTAVGALVALGLVRNVFNLFAARRWRGRRHEARTALAFAMVNGALSLASAHLVHWQLVALMEIPFQILLTNPAASGRVLRVWVGTVLAINGVVAWLDGVSPGALLVTLAASVFLHVVSGDRNELLREALATLDSTHRSMRKAHRRLESMHRRLQQQDRLTSLGTLAAGIAHEINNPMSYVTSNVQMLAEDLATLPSPSPLVREYVDEILPATLDGIYRVNSIVADLRRFARGETEAPTPFDLNHEVGVAARMAAKQIRTRAPLALELAPDLGPLLGQPYQIGQVILNLLVNAGQATGEEGHIRVTTRADGEDVLVEVSDDGMGMSAEVKRHLFEPFFTTKPPGQGTGLGLAAVHGIVQQHGGTIAVSSAPGKGATFTVRLPRRPPADRATRESPAPSFSGLRSALPEGLLGGMDNRGRKSA
jgi:signal transduction histidine kinase